VLESEETLATVERVAQTFQASCEEQQVHQE